MNITMEASLYMYSISCFIGFILMIMLKFGYKDYKVSAGYFLLFFLLSIVAPLLVIFRADLPIFVSVVISNSVFIVAYTFLYLGIVRLINKKVNILYLAIVFLVFLISIILFTYVIIDIKVRIIILNGTVATILIKAIFDIQSQKKKWRFFDEFMSIILMFLIFTMIIRTVGVYVFNENSISFLDFGIDPIFLFIIGMVNLMVIIGILSIYQNITSAKLSEVQRSNVSLISNLPGLAYRCLNDEFWTMLYLSEQTLQVTGYEESELIDNKDISYEDIIVDEFREMLRRGWAKAISNQESFAAEYQITRKDGEVIWVWEQGIPIIEPDGSCKYIEGLIMDVNNRKINENYLEYLSFNDVLTGLHNRRYYGKKIAELQGSDKYPISLILGDVDNLKFINDSFGHEEGDIALKYIAESLKVVASKGTIIRLGGDEFLIILTKTDKKAANKLISKIQTYILKNNTHSYQVSISLGTATAEDKSIDIVEAEKQAEDSMYRQKLYSKPSTKRKTIDAVLQTLFEKDELSEQHSRNVSYYCKRLAERIKLSKNETEEVETAALLHDVGKIIISKSTLTSEKKFTPEEWLEMKRHPEIGYRILYSVPELKEIANYILHHHERIDGKGYPNGIKGDEIPMVSKIISICDAFDAMVNKRYYKQPMSLVEAKAEILGNAGTQFDEELAKHFVEIIDDL